MMLKRLLWRIEKAKLMLSKRFCRGCMYGIGGECSRGHRQMGSVYCKDYVEVEE